MKNDLQVLVEWGSVLHSILDCTERFPKSVRFSFVQRIDGLILDMTQTIIDAQYAPIDQKRLFLSQVNSQLAKLRILLRVSADRKYLFTGQLKVFVGRLDGIGFQVYGWLTYVDKQDDLNVEDV